MGDKIELLVDTKNNSACLMCIVQDITIPWSWIDITYNPYSKCVNIYDKTCKM